MDSNINAVTLTTSEYNRIKNENFRYSLFIDNLIQGAELSDDHQSLLFDSKQIEESLKYCFLERYKKKLATLKTQNARYGDRK